MISGLNLTFTVSYDFGKKCLKKEERSHDNYYSSPSKRKMMEYPFVIFYIFKKSRGQEFGYPYYLK